MSTKEGFIKYVVEQISALGDVRYKKMFGEYMAYLNDKPIFLVCDNTVYVKILPETEALLFGAETGYPYDGAKLHFVLDIDDREKTQAVASALEAVTPVP